MNAIKAFLCTVSVSKFQLFSYAQWRQIYTGFRWYNLTREQVKVYARRKLSIERMSYCKHALEKGFSPEEMAEWLDMDLNGYVFRDAIEGRFMGIPKEKVYEYAKPGMSVTESFQICIRLIQEYSDK